MPSQCEFEVATGLVCTVRDKVAKRVLDRKGQKGMNGKTYCQGHGPFMVGPCAKREKCSRWIEHYEFDENGSYHYMAANQCVDDNYSNFLGFDDE